MAQIQFSEGPSSSAGAAAGIYGSQFGTTSLRVEDLEFNVTDQQLFDHFKQVSDVMSVRVCRDVTTRRSLGYGYVNYTNPRDAARALDVLNFTPFNGKTIRVMYSDRDPTVVKTGAENIFIKNLDQEIETKELHDIFSSYGSILSCNIATDASGQSKGYGFVQFDSEESAQNAIDKSNGMSISGKKLFVTRFLNKEERESALNKTKFNNVYVKNLSDSTTDDKLKKIFGEFGTITSAVVMRHGDGKSKCFGFVNFEKVDAAAEAIEALNGLMFDGKKWYVGKAQKKSEREVELKGRFDHNMTETEEQYRRLNLYVKNLDDSINEDKLKEMFSEFGTITSCKVMRDPSGISRGSGFVSFATPEEASRAIHEMNGKMVLSKALCVALAQRKEERRPHLQAQFSQMGSLLISPSVAPQMPMYPPSAPGLGQQFLYMQAPPTTIHPQPGFGYQQQLVPTMRPCGAPVPYWYAPMALQGPQGQFLAGLCGAGPVQQSQQQHQMMPRGQRYSNPRGRIMRNISLPAVGRPMPLSTLKSSLAKSTPNMQREMLGESLYPLVGMLEHESTAKVTGMLLELEQSEILHLIESPEALKTKVDEAMGVLVAFSRMQINSRDDQFAGPSRSS